jgi:hypothetical protein
MFFYGDAIGRDQQSCLYDIFIGEDIKILREQIKADKDKQTKLETEKAQLKGQYHSEDVLAFNDFFKHPGR